MKTKEKDKLKRMSIEGLEEQEIKLKYELTGQYLRNQPNIYPQKGAPTKLIRDTKRAIAFIKTIINEKRQLEGSIILNKDKKSKRRERRLLGRLKEEKKLKGGN